MKTEITGKTFRKYGFNIWGLLDKFPSGYSFDFHSNLTPNFALANAIQLGICEHIIGMNITKTQAPEGWTGSLEIPSTKKHRRGMMTVRVTENGKSYKVLSYVGFGTR